MVVCSVVLLLKCDVSCCVEVVRVVVDDLNPVLLEVNGGIEGIFGEEQGVPFGREGVELAEGTDIGVAKTGIHDWVGVDG